jgi:hypothetical protein
MKKTMLILTVLLLSNVSVAGDNGKASTVELKADPSKEQSGRDISQEKQPEPSQIQRNAEWERHKEFLRYLDTHEYK